MDTLPHIILFDLDGTLLDNSSAVVDAYASGLKKYEFKEKSHEYIARLAGLSTFETAKKLEVPDDQIHLIDAHFWEYFHLYADDPEKIPIIIDQVPELLNFLKLKNIKMGIITSNEASIAKKLLSKVGLIDFFEVIIGAEHVENKKPSPESVYLALDKLKVDEEYIDKEGVWLIGDTISDIGAANNAGILSISIPQKYTFDSCVKSDPDLLIDTLKDFFHLINN